MSAVLPPELVFREEISAWYTPRQAGSSGGHLTAVASAEAARFLERELGHSSTNFTTMTTAEDIYAIVQEVQRQYEAKAEKKKVLKWLSRFSEKIMYYSGVLDMLSQHHPEYVALVWGSMKLVLMGLIKHADILHKFSKALVEIGSVLPRTKLNADLYQTDHMQNAVARLQGHIMIFFQDVVKWYRKCSTSRALSAIFKPFDVEYKDTLEEIRACSGIVDEIANTAGRAEVRDIRIYAQLQHQSLDTQNQKLDAQNQKLKEIQNQVTELLILGAAHRSITERVQLDVGDMRPRIYSIQFSQVLTALQPKTPPEDDLFKLRSLTSRVSNARPSAIDAANFKLQLGRWLSRNQSSFFIVRAGPRAEMRSKKIAIDLIALLQSCGCGVIWNISALSTGEPQPSLSRLVKSLIFQVLDKHRELLDRSFGDLDIAKFQEHHIDTEWIDLLMRLVSKLENHFIIVETEQLFQANRQDQQWSLRFLQIFQAMVDSSAASGKILKILLVSYNTPLTTLANLPSSERRIVAPLSPPAPVPPRLRRGLYTRKAVGGEWVDLRSKIWKGKA